MKKKILAVVLAVVILAVAAVGATLAYLTAKSETIVNTFTLGNVSISLTETPFENKKLIPGTTYAKDPKVTVDAQSEDCYLFVKIVEDNGALCDGDDPETDDVETAVDALTWAAATGWTLVAGETDVYYYTGEITKGTPINVLAGAGENTDGQVTVNSTLTQENINTLQDALTDAGEDAAAKAAAVPSLTITAYAIQANDLKDGEQNPVDNAADAWALLKDALN